MKVTEMKNYIRVFYSYYNNRDQRIAESKFFHTMEQAILFISENPRITVIDGPTSIQMVRKANDFFKAQESTYA